MIKQLTIRYEGVYIIWYVQIKNKPDRKNESTAACRAPGWGKFYLPKMQKSAHLPYFCGQFQNIGIKNRTIYGQRW
jgi:hypothetical protein